jgi:hypothetical protein
MLVSVYGGQSYDGGRFIGRVYWRFIRFNQVETVETVETVESRYGNGPGT